MSKKDNELKLDFSSVSRKWSMALARANVMLQRSAMRLDVLSNDLDTTDDLVQAALDDLERMQAARDSFLVQVVEDVPAGWLVSHAPDDITWDEAGALDYLQAPRYVELVAAINEGLSAPAGKSGGIST